MYDRNQGLNCLTAAKILKFALFPVETASWGTYGDQACPFHKLRYGAMKGEKLNYNIFNNFIPFI
jgi:hypothetical protein